MTKSHVRQALDGAKLPHDEPVRCADCGTHLSEGSPVTVAADRDNDVWRVQHIWGAACAPISGEEFGTADALAEADLGTAVDTATQQHHLILLSVVVIDEPSEQPPEIPERIRVW